MAKNGENFAEVVPKHIKRLYNLQIFSYTKTMQSAAGQRPLATNSDQSVAVIEIKETHQEPFNNLVIPFVGQITNPQNEVIISNCWLYLVILCISSKKVPDVRGQQLCSSSLGE